jgi:cyclophilin family peptidyl-prolyl cis-trans isomerase
MIKKIKTSFSEKILFIFLISLGIFSFSFFFIIKNKCLFVENVDPKKIQFTNLQNIAIMNVECGNVIIELEPNLSPNAVKRFKYLIQNGSYNRSAFYKVIKDTLIQAGDLEYGNIDNINYYKVGSGKSGLGTIKSELNENFQFDEGSVAFARSDEFDTEDSEFFITLKKIPLYVGEYTPIGKVIYGLDALKKIKAGDKVEYVLRPDFINSFKLLN